MLPTRANGQGAAASYIRDAHGAYQAHGIVVLTVATAAVTKVVSFSDPALVTAFGFPSVLEPSVARTS
jgi:RNA polymerase sigma-70 factor (ECF subfamily)